nr:MAG TPA: hypothetical protein [Caudoviricetes sp.]
MVTLPNCPISLSTNRTRSPCPESFKIGSNSSWPPLWWSDSLEDNNISHN